MKPPTRQEMLDKAVTGLRKQGFQRSVKFAGSDVCVYDDGLGNKCAWGHVDPVLTRKDTGGVLTLTRGLAPTLPLEDLKFARALQKAHDDGFEPDLMLENLRLLATEYNLTFPEAE